MLSIEALQPRAARLLDQAITRGAECVVIRGEAGSGKSMMLDRVAGTPGARTIRLNVMWGALEDQQMLISSAATQVEDVVPGAAGGAGGITHPARGTGWAEEPTAAFVRLVDRLLAAGGQRRDPLWILVDDVDALHEDLLPGLRHAIARTAHLPGGVVCTSTWPVPALESYERIDLDPLREEVIGPWVEARTGVRPPHRVVRQLHQRSGGHVSILAGLTEHASNAALGGSRRLVHRPPNPAAQRHAARTLATVPAPTRELLTTIAQVGAVDMPTFTALAADSDQAGDQLLATGLFESDGARVHVADGVLADALAHGARDTRRAACQRVLDAASDVLGEDDRLLMSALTSERDPAHAGPLGDQALAAVRRGDSCRAHAFVSAMAEHTTSENYARFAATRVRVTLLDGYLEDAAEQAADDLPRLPMSRERLHVAQILVASRFLLGHRLELGTVHDEVQRHAAAEPVATAPIARMATLLALNVGQVDTARRIAELTESVLPAPLLRGPAWQYMRARLSADANVADLRRYLRRWMADSRPDDLGLDLQTEIAFREEPQAAQHHLRAELSRPMPSLHRAVLLTLSAYLESGEGELGRARAALQELDDLQPLERFLTSLRASVALRCASMPGAPALTVREAQIVEKAILDRPHLLTHRLWINRAAWLLATDQRQEEARGLLAAAAADRRPDANALATLGDVDFELVGPALHVALCVDQGRAADARRYLQTVLASRAERSSHVHAATRLGMALLRTEQSEHQIDWNELLATSRFPRWALPALKRVVSRHSGTRTPHAEPDSAAVEEGLAPGLRLTPRESEVAARIVRGMRNRDIAAELYLSVRSVEATITKLFRKTGTRSRAGLAAALLRIGERSIGEPPHHDRLG
ncbi:helix-turn-helix transcriptional regulator [Georgenia alba]|uniref:LuxR C-terminal-related transcriptional regulator n=1 Tax=Georgenia alba TaxID=2233858 RepID=A0ABW2Q5W1_9MICO